MIMSPDLNYPRVFLLPQFLHLKAALVRKERSSSYLFSYTISFKDPSDDQISRWWLLGTFSSYFYINHTCMNSPSSSCRFGNRSHSDESSSAPHSVLKSSDVTRERHRHVTWSWCLDDVKGTLGHLWAFWDPHTNLSDPTGPGRHPNLSFMCCSHKERVTACGFWIVWQSHICFFFWMVFNSEIHWDY